jgi:hypothetical protein
MPSIQEPAKSGRSVTLSRNLHDRQRLVRYLGAGSYHRFWRRRERRPTLHSRRWRQRLVLAALVLLAVAGWGMFREGLSPLLTSQPREWWRQAATPTPRE